MGEGTPPSASEPVAPRPEPRDAIRARVEAFRAQIRPGSLPLFLTPTAPKEPTPGACWSCGDPANGGRCPLCTEAAHFVVEELLAARPASPPAEKKT